MAHTGRAGMVPPPQPKDRRPGVVFQPHTYYSLKCGVDQLANTLRPTLGPLFRTVAVADPFPHNPPEILDDGSTIGRRLVELPNRSANVGAMLLRHALWRMQEEVGDGTTTMAVIFQSILSQSIHYLTGSSGNAMRLRRGLERNLPLVLAALRQAALPLIGRDRITQIANNLCHDQELALLLGEIFDLTGAEGTVHIEGRSRPGLERQYIEGTFWKHSGWHSALMETDSIRHHARLDDVAILISDISVENAGQLISLMHNAVQAKISNLIIVALTMSSDAIELLLRNRQAKVINTFAVRTPMTTAPDQAAALQDLAVLTGGRFLCRAAGESLSSARVADLGRARQAWATAQYFGLVGGQGDTRQLRQHIASTKEAIKQTEGEEKQKLRQRLGRLLGGAAILRVGGITEAEMKMRRALAERMAVTLRTALEGGIVPGGGVALLNCQAALENHLDCLDSEKNQKGAEEKAARRILSKALEEPLRVIAANAGYEPGLIVERVKTAPAGYGFDARDGHIAEMNSMGIVDSVSVLEAALRLAVSGAAMALTTDVIVHRRQPPRAIEP